MKRKLLIISVILVILCLIGVGTFAYFRMKSPIEGASVAQEAATEASTPDCSFSDTTMLDKINAVRTNKLMVDTYLDDVSQKRADTMPYDLDNHAGFRSMASDGTLVKYPIVNEILASNRCASTEQIFSQWRNSPSHWSAITDERYDVVGIGFNGQSAVVIFGDLR